MCLITNVTRLAATSNQQGANTIDVGTFSRRCDLLLNSYNICKQFRRCQTDLRSVRFMLTITFVKTMGDEQLTQHFSCRRHNLKFTSHCFHSFSLFWLLSRLFANPS